MVHGKDSLDRTDQSKGWRVGIRLVECPSLTMAGPKELATGWQVTKAEAGIETASQSREDSIRKALAEQAGNGGDFCLPSPMRWRESRESTTPQRPPPDAHPPWRAEPRFGTRGLSSHPRLAGGPLATPHHCLGPHIPIKSAGQERKKLDHPRDTRAIELASFKRGGQLTLSLA
jgi:hypothetical protein